jgi:EAL domain-containing protein (putative c-di-GMP-specific phosphodiesterase class I)
VIAEGVENKAQLEFLQGCHCHDMQGFFFSRPMSAEEMTGMFQKGLAGGGVCLFH